MKTRAEFDCFSMSDVNLKGDQHFHRKQSNPTGFKTTVDLTRCKFSPPPTSPTSTRPTAPNEEILEPLLDEEDNEDEIVIRGIDR